MENNNDEDDDKDVRWKNFWKRENDVLSSIKQPKKRESKRRNGTLI